ncbi:MAG: PQQ-binding-like beta-propeller repeat protein [Verrucomicrobiota bacterium]
MPHSLFVFSLVFFCALSAGFSSENWPGWRGPRGDGSVIAPNLPVKWSLEDDVRWKVELPGKGHSSPIIWEDRIFVVTAIEETRERVLQCLDRTTGEEVWRKTVLEAPFEGIHRLNSRASSTPATDGRHVYVSFLDEGNMFIAAYDYLGNQVWVARPGVFSSKHGYCSSPILWDNKVIINGDHDGNAYIVALDRRTGQTLWKTDRPNKTRSYCTPIIRTIGDRNQMILSGSKSVASFDPDTGRQHWVMDGPTEQFVASLVYNGRYLFLTCGFPERHMMAIRPDGSGNVTDTAIVWRTTKGASYVPSPVSIGDYFLVVADNGVASCFEADSGERLWQERLIADQGISPKHSASLLAANGLAYFLSDSGVMTVVRPGPSLEIVGTSYLDEEAYASPAVYDNQLFVRGLQHLFCIGKK